MFSDNVTGLSVLAMILSVHTKLRDHISRTLHTLYGIEPDAGPSIALEYPPTRELGDLGSPVAFELARRLRKAPKLIAQEIADASGGVQGMGGLHEFVCMGPVPRSGLCPVHSALRLPIRPRVDRSAGTAG